MKKFKNNNYKDQIFQNKITQMETHLIGRKIHKINMLINKKKMTFDFESNIFNNYKKLFRINKLTSNFSLLLLFLCFSFFDASGQSVNCYAVADNGNDPQLYLIDCTTAEASYVGALAIDQDVEAIELWLDMVTLYGIASEGGNDAPNPEFGEINTTTGAWTTIGEIGVFNGPTSYRPYEMDAITHDENGIMWAISNEPLESVLLQINVTTGSYVPNAFGLGNDYLLLSGPGSDNIEDMAYDVTTGEFYITAQESGNAVLFDLDVTTGVTTEIIEMVQCNGDVESLTVTPSGQMKATSGNGGGGQKDDTCYDEFYLIDKTTGVITTTLEINPQDGHTDFESMSCPGAGAALCILSTASAFPQACQDSGTSGDASDDVFDVTVDASAVNGGTQFSVSDGTNIYGPFDYGTGGTVTGLTADGSTITLTFTDAGDETCTESVDVSQSPCSSACSLSPTATPQACQDSGTSGDASDDVFDVTVDASAVNGSTQFSVSDGTNTFGPFDYGTGGTVTGLTADGSTITLTFTDAGDATCTGSADVSQNPCSSACSLSPTATPQACQDSGTSGDASDDVFDVTVDASSVNGGTQFSVSDGTNTYGPFDYGTGGTVTGLTADGSTITLTYTDAGDETCTGSADVSQNPCSSACTLSPTATPQACQDSGTSSDASDDVFDVTVDASAVNGGTQFSVSDGTNTYGPFDYGTGGTVTGLTADGSTITLTFTDAGDATCTGSVDVSQNSCSNDPGCIANSGTLTADETSHCLSDDMTSVDLTATPNGDMVVPADFEVTYVLTSNPGLVIEQVGTSPSFTVSAVGNYIIHTLVAETSDAASPDYLDLSGVVLGTTTAVELLPAIEAVCASLDAEGASIIVSETVIDVLPCDDGTIDLVVEEGYDSYQWYKDGIMIDAADGGTSETLTISEAGEYVYTVNGADLDSECGERMCCPVIISEDPNCTECGPIKCLTGTAIKN